jgi:hypothetical protein
MRKNIVLLGAAGISASLVAGSAEAKLIRYEINGQRYSYSTNNRQQTLEARERIAAAAAAESAQARADKEAAANPLVRLFGSPAQREAAQSLSRVQQVAPSQDHAQQAPPAEGQTEIVSTSSVGRSGAVRRRSARPAALRAVRQASLERSGKLETGRGQTAVDPSAATRDEGLATQAQIPAPIAEPLKPVMPAADMSSSTAPVIPFSAGPRTMGGAGGNSLTDFVNQVRKAPAEGIAPRM